MKNYLKYHSLVILKNTSYIYLCAFMIIMAFLCVLVMITDPQNIELINYPPAFISFFWMNPMDRVINSICMLLLPLITIIPVLQSIQVENKAFQMILTRSYKLKYLISKMIIFFLSGFSLTLIFLTFHMIFSYIIFSSDIQNIFFYASAFVPNNTYLLEMIMPFPDLYLSNPILLSILYMLGIAFLQGILSLVTMCINTYAHHSIFSYIFCFLLMSLNTYFQGFIPSVIIILEPYSIWSQETLFLYTTIYIIIFTVFISVSSYIEYKKDAL